MKNNYKSTIMTVIGFILIIAGLVAVKMLNGDSHVEPYLSIGVGCGIFGQGLGELLTRLGEKNHPELAHQREIEENDERNIALRDRAQAKAYRIMILVFGALLLAFGLMHVEMKVILLLVLAYLYICGCSVFYNVKYRKEM